MKTRAAALAATAALAIVPLTGCGGSGSDTSSSTTATTASSGDTSAGASVSKATFIKEADAICTKAGKQTETEYATYAKKNKIVEGIEPSSTQIAVVTKTILVPALKRQTKEIGALDAPANDEALINEFLEAVSSATKKAEEEPQAGQSPEKLLAKADKLIANYGFKVCGQR